MKSLLLLVIAPTLLLSGCGGWTPSDAQITAAVQMGTATGLRLAIHDAGKRTEIANYLNVGAAALRTVTGSPTPDQLTKLLNDSIPASVRDSVPELMPYIVPVVVSLYQLAYEKYGADQKKLYEVLGAIAVGLETGSAPYITPKA